MNFISLNVNGLLNPTKQRKTISKLKKENIDIAFLQETHMTGLEHEKLKRQGFKYVFASSNGLRHTRGVAILISGKIMYDHISTIKDKEGRFIMIKGKIDGNMFTFYNIYIPPNSDLSFYMQVFDKIATEAQGVLICAGDLNTTLGPDDSSGRRPAQSNRTTKKINSIILELGLVDVWRHMNPSIRDYTHFSHPNSSYSRLDYYLLFGTDVNKVQKCHIGTMDLSDHSPVFLSLTTSNRKRNTLWRFNPSILTERRTEEFSKDITEYLELNDNGEVSPTVLWDACKAVMRGKVIAVTSFLKKCRTERLNILQTELKHLETRHKDSIDPTIKVEIATKRNQIDQLYNQDIQKKMMYTKQKYYEGGSKYTKLLAYKLRKQQADNTIYKITDPNTKVTHHGLEEIKKCFTDYYKNLYSQPPVTTDDQMHTLLNSLNLPTLTAGQNRSLKASISQEEILSAIARLKANKSPGTDGFTSEWYKALKEVLTPFLQKTFNWVLTKNEIPISWNEAFISVIPKGDKDRMDCGNYRPISVLNLDYKLFTSILAKRLEHILPEICHFDQTGFVSSRQTHDNIRRSIHVIDHINQNKIPAMLVSVDAFKAFDSVRYKFLFAVMEKFGFDQVFIKVVESLYNRPSARLKINGELSDSFLLERSSRQGCPISPILFAIFIEPLAQCIRQHNSIKGIVMPAGEQKLALFADDILLFLSSPTESLPALMSVLEEYGSYSGYKINEQKTQALNMYYNPPQCLRSRYKIRWDKQYVKYLGIVLPTELSKLEELNYVPLRRDILADIDRWNLIPYLNLSSRIESVKMNVLPRLLYLFLSVPISKPEQFFSDWDKVISRFVWAGKKPRVRLKTLQLPKERGGLALPCLRDYYRAAQIRPLIGWCKPSYKSRWKDIESTMGRGLPINSLIGDPSLIKHLSNPQNVMITGSLKVWSEIVRRYELKDKIGTLKWFAYDPDFRPSRYDMRFRSWIGKGLSAYCTLLKQGNVMAFQDLKDKFDLQNQDLFRYLQIRDFINRKILRREDETAIEIIQLFQNAYADSTYQKIVSRLYGVLQDMKGDNTLNIKARWEAEGNIDISAEEWERICEHQWKMTSSPTWREFSWKNLSRFFCTPAQKRHFTNQSDCWRLCGETLANHFHVFWSCPSVVPFWRSVHSVLEEVFGVDIPFDFNTMYFVDLKNLQLRKRDEYLMRVLLVASKKAITKKWLTNVIPTMNEWIDLIYGIYIMERITFSFRGQSEAFTENWFWWITYISDTRPDFV